MIKDILEHYLGSSFAGPAEFVLFAFAAAIGFFICIKICILIMGDKF